ncbi:MAG: transcriptional repressor LexA [Bdellovibrionota bacterium]
MREIETTLSPKQARILTLIEAAIAKTGRPPTYRDLARDSGVDAVGTIQDHIQALIRKGFLEREKGVARGLRLAHRSESIDVPILGSVPAGRPIEAIQDSQGTISVPARWKGDLFALKVKGESMIDAGIHDGDFVVVKKQSHAEHGEIIVAMIDGEATVKTLERTRGRVRLLPQNPRFEPIEIPPESENVIQGKVVSVMRFYS